jgi:hypothetical protein
MTRFNRSILSLLLGSMACGTASAQIAVRGKTVHTMAGPAIQDGMIVVQDGKITAIGRADQIAVPEGFKVLEAEIVTPGLVDAHTTVGFSGIYNIRHDQDQLESSAPIQPELRAVDAHNAADDLIEWVRSFGVTTIHAGHAPGELISGQTLIAKTIGNSVSAAALVESKAVAATLTTAAIKEGSKSPGTRGKSMAMLRAELIRAREHREKQARTASRLPASAARTFSTAAGATKGSTSPKWRRIGHCISAARSSAASIRLPCQVATASTIPSAAAWRAYGPPKQMPSATTRSTPGCARAHSRVARMSR